MAQGRLLADGPVRELFRDRELMKRASLLPPQMIELSGRLGGDYAQADDAETLARMIAERRNDGNGRRTV